MILRFFQQNSEVRGDTKWCVESIKIRKVTENEHVLTSERAGPLLSGYIRASEASFSFRCFCLHCKLWADMWKSFCGWTFLFVIYCSSLAHVSLNHREKWIIWQEKERGINQQHPDTVTSTSQEWLIWPFLAKPLEITTKLYVVSLDTFLETSHIFPLRLCRMKTVLTSSCRPAAAGTRCVSVAQASSLLCLCSL